MSDITTYYQINREIISNRAKEYYKNYKEVLREQAKFKYTELIDEKKIKREYGRNRGNNMSEANKQKLKEYQQNYCKAKKLL